LMEMVCLMGSRMDRNGKRYLVLTEKFPPRKGGSNTTFEEVYRRIGGKDTHIVANSQPGASAFDRTSPNTVHRLDLERRPWLKPESLGIYVKLFLKALALRLEHPFDEIHCGRVLSEGFVGWLVSVLTRTPLVIYAHGEEITTWRTPVKYRFMRFTYRRADAVIANSRFTADLLAAMGVPEGKIHVILPGVDLDLFRPCEDKDLVRSSLGIAPETKLIFSVGRLTRRKGFHQVVRALPHLVGKGLQVRYVVAGIGPDREYLLDIARECGVADRVRLLGAVTDDELVRWYQAADVFAMPNYDVDNDTEGFGKVYVEASACKTPSVAGRTGGTGDAVLDGVTGLRVDGSSVSAVAEALQRLLSAPGLCSQLAEQAHRRAVTEFSWDAAAVKIAGILGGWDRR